MANSNDDIGRVALGAPALKEVFIVSIPDCALVKSWARSGRVNEDEAAARFGALFRSATAAIGAATTGQAARIVTVEAPDALVRLEAVSDELIACFVFDRTAPLGLVNVQAMQLCDHIRASIDEFERPTPAPSVPTYRATEHPVAGDLGGTPQGFEREDTPLATPNVAFPETTESTPADGSPRPKFAPTLIEAATPFEMSRDDVSTIEDDAPESAPPAKRPAMNIADAATTPGLTPRVVRLLEFFRRYVPDRHAAMLRLSLRTGIPLERLESPDGLDEAQVEAIATAVRDILGQDKVGV